MRIVADFHIHSKYARATSPSCDVDGLSTGAKLKGINVLATGDFTHPQYFKELKMKLARKEESGLYDYNGIKFILSTEVANFFQLNENGKTKKVHNIILAPNLAIAEQINDCLGKDQNLSFDGRPILKMSCAEMVEKMQKISKEIAIIPAHCWTPWFGVFGSVSGVNSIEEAFEDKANKIFALETGLSSDPAMNWMISKLDKYTLISNSDCHSLEKLGREANVFELQELSYKSILNTLKTKKGFVKTYEFYPEEGKYHYDGHRDCKIILNPNETKKYKGICPVCRKKLTVGVMNRITELSDREVGYVPKDSVPFQHIIPLRTIISKALKKSETTLGVEDAYQKLIKYFGNEFAIYEANEDQIRLSTSKEISTAIIKSNSGNVTWIPGYDGVFGELILDSKKNNQIVKDRKQSSLTDF
ncbi:MAG: endonuclease Q family protein [Candidatus Micrarchaeota archaeon]